MSVITAMVNKTAYSYEDAFNAKDCTSDVMRTAIQEWFDLYFETVPTKDHDPCMRIAYTVVNKLVKTAFGEYEVTTNDDVFVKSILDALEPKRKKAMQMALIGGECLLKPTPTPTGWLWTVINRGSVLVFGRDLDGHPADIGTAEYTTANNDYYTLLERRTLDESGYLTVTNKLYRSSLKGALGTRVNLSDLPRYADLQEVYTFPTPLHTLGMVQVKTPMVNCVDGSDDSVSVYAAAAGLIRNINRNEAQVNGEFERGESRIMVSDDLIRTDASGRQRLKDNVFVGIPDVNPEDVGITIFSPELREASFFARKQEYLRSVESVIGLKRGILSEVEAAERTATEITSSAGDYNLTIIDFQQMWENAVKEAVRICGILGPLYHVPGAHAVGEDAFSIDWGNGILYDEDKTWADYKDMVASGLLKPEIAVGWRFNMPIETPEDLAAIRAKYMPELESLTGNEEDDDV